MTQPPYGGPNPPPDGPQNPPEDPYDRAYPPAVDPYESAPSDYSPGFPQSPPPSGYAPFGYQQAGQPDAGYPAPGYPPAGQPQPGYPGSGYPPVSGPGYAPPGHPYPAPGQPYPPSGQPFPSSGPPASGQPAFPPYGPVPVPKKKRGAMISAIVAAVLVLCAAAGTSAWLLLRNVETGTGSAEPAAAVGAFLKAVYTEKSADQAAQLVCAEARDDGAIAKKVDEIKGYDEKYDSPRFDWSDPKVESQNDERAIVSVKLRMITADEKTAEQQLKLTVVQKTGWWVCEVG